MLQLSIEDPASVVRICHALSTPLRVNIVRGLDNQVLSCLELSKALGYPLSTISSNVKILEEAGLVICDLLPAKNGSKKLCSLVYGDILMRVGSIAAVPETASRYEADIPIGNYMDFKVAPSCGLVVDHLDADTFDEVNRFYSTERVNAQLLWFRKGYVEYRVPVAHRGHLAFKSIAFELEICSEAPGFNNKWKSDITMWINDIEIGTWTAPADFGDRRGHLTPRFWAMGNTQYGILTNWSVSEEGATINSEPLSDVKLSALGLGERNYISMRIGVKSTSKHVGGINIFGDKFGDYPQNIRMYIYYKDRE